MSVRELTAAALSERFRAGAPTYLIDVREAWERALVELPDALHVPLGELSERLDEVTPPAGALVVVYCHHGVRSLSGVAILSRHGVEAKSLAGGVEAYAREIDPSLPRY